MVRFYLLLPLCQTLFLDVVVFRKFLGSILIGVFWLPRWLSGKVSACQGGHSGSIPWSGRSLEEEMAIHSNILAWEIPWTEEPARLQSIGSQRVRHDLVTEQHGLYQVRGRNSYLFPKV